MPAIINFSSVFVRTLGLTLGKDGKVVKINCTGSMTKELRQKMNWNKGEAPEGSGDDFRTVEDAATEIKLEGTLNASEVHITPNEEGLKSRAVKFDIREVSDFKLVNVVDSDGGANKQELRFQIVSNAPGVVGKLEKYLDLCGQAKATFKVSYHKQARLDEQPEQPEQPELEETLQ